MVQENFTHIRTWIFDLDNTLYPPSTSLFPQIEVLMTSFIMRKLGVTREKAIQLRTQYWRDHGTTLAGLMANHDIPAYPYLVDVHDIDFSVLSPDLDLRSAIEALKGRKIVFTNGTAPYAQNVLEARGLSDLFENVYGVEHTGFIPKPRADAYAQILELDGLDPAYAAFFEDDPRNLEVPHALGMKTVHIAPTPAPRPYIDYHSSNLTTFLQGLSGN